MGMVRMVRNVKQEDGSFRKVLRNIKKFGNEATDQGSASFLFTPDAQTRINGGEVKVQKPAKAAVYSLRLLVPSEALANLGASERDEIKTKTGCTGMKFLGKSTPGTREGMRILQFKGSRKAVKAGEEIVEQRLPNEVEFLRLERVQERKRTVPRVPPGFEHVNNPARGGPRAPMYDMSRG